MEGKNIATTCPQNPGLLTSLATAGQNATNAHVRYSRSAYRFRTSTPTDSVLTLLDNSLRTDDEESLEPDTFDTLLEPLNSQFVRSKAGNGNVSSLGSFHGQQRVTLPSVCTCIQTQAEQLGQLRNVEQRQCPIRLDTMLKYTIPVLKASERILQCPVCWKDSQLFMLTILVFRSVFCWAQQLRHNQNGRSLSLKVMVGHYDVSTEEDSMIKDLLLSRVLCRSKKLLHLLKARIEKAAAAPRDSSRYREMESVDMEYVQQSLPLLTQTAISLSRPVTISDFHSDSSGH